MHRYFKGGLTGLLIAIAAWAASCERSRTPVQPTASDASRPQTVAATAGEPLTVSWHCMAAGSQFLAADCAVRGSGSVRLSSRAALTAPATPSNLSGGATGARVSLAWSAPAASDPATSYIVEAGSSTGRLDLANFDTGTSAPSLTVDNVPPGTYFVRVRARNSAGVSGASNELVLIVFGAAGCPPAAPTGLTATSSGSTVTLRWTAPGGACVAAGYIVEAGSAPGAANLANFNTGTTSTSYVATGVGAGTYYVRVRASNAAGNSAASNEATLVVATGCTAPPNAPGLTGSVAGTTVSVAWSAVPGAASYRLEAGTAPGLSNVVVSDQGAATSLTAVAAPGTYYVRVKATNACGASAPSNEIVLSVGTSPCSYAVSPTTASVAIGGGSVSVAVTTSGGCAWSASSNASFITISSGAGGTGNGTVTFAVAANPTSAARTGTLTIAGQTVTVTQAGVCTFTLSANQVSVDAAGGSATIGVTASAGGCTWTAQSGASFVSIPSGSSGAGNGTVSLSIQSNGGPGSRSATATIAGTTVSVSQNSPLPESNVTRNQGCPAQNEAPAPGSTSIQFINQRPETITVFRPGTADSSAIPPFGGLNKSTFDKTVWQVSTSNNGCLASFTASAAPGSAIVR